MFFEETTQEDQELEALSIVTGPLLAVDIGTVNTRAMLLDIVDGTYRFIARGEAPTTAVPPWNDVSEGVNRALREISQASGRILLDDTDTLIVPERTNFRGVSGFAVTASAGRPVRTVLVGLVPDVSVSSGRRAAEATYLQVEDILSLGDERTQEQQIDALLAAGPDLIMIVGGTDGGATQSLNRLLEVVALACSMMDEEEKPEILFAGNAAMSDEIHAQLTEGLGLRVSFADNVRPSLDVEQLDSAQDQLAEIFQEHKSLIRGFAALGHWTELGNQPSRGVLPTAKSFGRITKIVSALERSDVLGVDLGSTTTTIAASVRGAHYLNVHSNLGMGHSAQDLFTYVRPEHLQRWLVSRPDRDEDILNHVWNKWLFPATVPATRESLELEYAMAREAIRIAVLSSRSSWRGVRQYGLLPPFGVILLTGATLSKAPHPGWSALVALDALQPVGVVRLLLDTHNLGVALGSLAPLNSTAIAHVLETGAFLNLGTVVAPVGRARWGEVVLRGVLIPEGVAPEAGRTFEVRYGSIVRLPLAPGVKARLKFRLRRLSLEEGTDLEVTGGALGVIIDARGRPWRFPRDPERRLTALREWQAAMGEEERA